MTPPALLLSNILIASAAGRHRREVVSEARNSPIPIRPDPAIPPASAHWHGLPFRRPALQGWVADEAMPDHGLERLGQGRHPVRVDLRNQYDHIAMPSGIAIVPADDPEHLRRARLGQVDGLDDIDADVALGIAAADRID